jgi:hypothetical protein
MPLTAAALTALPSIISGTASLGQAAIGGLQYQKGKKIGSETVRPEYVIPEEVAANLTAAELAALEGLSAEQKQAYVENIQRSTQGAMASLKDRNLGVTGASAIHQKESDAYREMMGMDVAAKQLAEKNLAQARLTSAGFKERQFDINQMQPYMQDYMESQALMGSGLQNIGLGFGTIANTASQFSQDQADLEKIKAIYG